MNNFSAHCPVSGQQNNATQAMRATRTLDLSAGYKGTADNTPRQARTTGDNQGQQVR